MNKRRGMHAGFTLVEILVAIAVFSILIVVLAAMLGQVNKMWTRSQAQNQRQQSGRALLNYLARDIAKAMLPLSVGNQESLQLLINPPALSTSYGNRDNIFFQAPIATTQSTQSVGEVAEVGYFIQWQGSNAALCRFFVNPSDAPNFQIYNTPTAWLTPAIVASVAPAISPNYQGLVAENVIGLWVNAYNSAGTSVLDANRQYDSRSKSDLPAIVEVSILVLDPGTAKLLSVGAISPASVQALVQSASYLNATQCLTNLPSTIRSGANSFTTRVQLRNAL